jgi:hypothetical protein
MTICLGLKPSPTGLQSSSPDRRQTLTFRKRNAFQVLRPGIMRRLVCPFCLPFFFFRNSRVVIQNTIGKNQSNLYESHTITMIASHNIIGNR